MVQVRSLVEMPFTGFIQERMSTPPGPLEIRSVVFFNEPVVFVENGIAGKHA